MRAQSSGRDHPYLVTGASFLMMMTIWGSFSTFGVFFEPLIDAHGWTRTLISGAASLNNLTFGVACILTARLCDRIGARILFSATALLLGGGYFAMGWIHSPQQLYFFYGVVIALGMSGYIPVLTIVARRFSAARGMVTGLVLSGMGLGTLIAPLGAAWLIGRFDWRGAYLIIGPVAFLTLVVAAQFMGSRGADGSAPGLSGRGGKEKPDEGAVQGLSLPEAIRTGRFRQICFLYFAFLFSLLTVLVHIVIHATGTGIPASDGARILAVIGGLCIVGMNAMGRAADRVGTRSAMTASFLLMACAMFWLLFARELWMFHLFAVIFGFAYGGMQTLFSPIVAELFGLRSHGTILSTAALAGTAGAVSGPLLAGYVHDLRGSYDIALFLCALLAVASALTAPLLRPLRGQSRRRAPGAR